MELWHSVSVMTNPRIPLVACALCNGFATILLWAPLSVNTHQLCFWVLLELRDRGVSMVITQSNTIAVLHVGVKNTTTNQQKVGVSNWRIRRTAWICLFFECFILKIDWILCCCFGIWLPVCSVLNSAQLMHHMLATINQINKNGSLAYLLLESPDCQSSSGVDT